MVLCVLQQYGIKMAKVGDEVAAVGAPRLGKRRSLCLDSIE